MMLDESIHGTRPGAICFALQSKLFEKWGT